MGLTMAQHRQAPSQFIKDEPGHDSVSLHSASFQVRNHQFHHMDASATLNHQVALSNTKILYR